MNALDLFAGAGGFSLGLHLAGVEVTGAIEADQNASTTFRSNFPKVAHHQRPIETCTTRWLRHRFKGVELVVGGPPCQGFSVAGPTQYGRVDGRNSLILEMARVIMTLLPRYAVMENVKGILSGKLADGRRALDVYLDVLAKAGYTSKVFVLQAADFSVPQKRERIFVVSGRQGEPLPSLIESASPGVRYSVDDAIGDLPPLVPGAGVDSPVPYPCPPANAYQALMRKGSEGFANHVAMKHTPRIVERLRTLGYGDSLENVAATHGQRRRNSGEIVRDSVYKMNCTRLDPAKPSLALPANFQTIHVHPHQPRMLTAREGARIQSFPDTFVFRGPRTTMSRKLLEREGRLGELGLSQYNQIGNSVPPLLAKAIATALRECASGRELPLRGTGTSGV
ncbi:MAG TPA: DNA cytosine methyltransferase [Archangium sp.]|uniref:DNA cytosine methyltransferase n=1 Tax=Archangium sp. TaxID=1872627 RepID=UPI002ED96C14